MVSLIAHEINLVSFLSSLGVLWVVHINPVFVQRGGFLVHPYALFRKVSRVVCDRVKPKLADITRRGVRCMTTNSHIMADIYCIAGSLVICV